MNIGTMKTFLLTVISLSFLCCQSGQVCFQKENCEAQSWYKPLLLQLCNERKIDSVDAYVLKMLRSTIPREPEDFIKKYGNIEKEDIKLLCIPKETADSIVYIFTQTSGCVQMFAYLIKPQILIRVNKKECIMGTRAEEFTLKENNDSSMIFCDQNILERKNDEGRWFKYFYYEKKRNTFYHFKNCRIINGQEECNIFKK